MKERRPAGHGTIEPLPSGRFRARVPLADGVRHDVGTHDTWDEANAMIVAFVERAAKENLAPVGGLTARALAAAYADELELSRSYAAMPNVRSIIRTHIDNASFADWPARRVTRDAIKHWFKALNLAGVSPAYQGQILVQVRKVFAYGVDSRRLEANPAEGFVLPRAPVATEEPWTYLETHEQSSFTGCEAVEEAWRLLVEVAFTTGLRSKEQSCMHLADAHVTGSDPHLVVRYGTPWRAPKGRRIRRVPLLPQALRAIERWLELLDTWCPPSKNRRGFRGEPLLFPGPQGGRLDSDRFAPEYAGEEGEFQRWLRLAGITRHVRWHDLRHTCGASLISGWWGRPWRLEEIRDFLGHQSIDETQRYAHLGHTALKQAAYSTPGPIGGGSGGGVGGGTNDRVAGPRAVHQSTQPSAAIRNVLLPRHPPKSPAKNAEDQDNLERVGSAWTDAKSVAEALIRAASAREECGALVIELASKVLGAPEVTLASAALAGGPNALDRALELAALVAPEASRREAGSA